MSGINLPVCVREFCITGRAEIPAPVRSDLSLLVAMSRLNGTQFTGWELDGFIEEMAATAVESNDRERLNDLWRRVAFALRLATVSDSRVESVREDVEERLEAINNAIEALEEAQTAIEDLDANDQDACGGSVLECSDMVERLYSQVESVRETLEGIIDPSDEIEESMMRCLDGMEHDDELGIEVGDQGEGRRQVEKAIAAAIGREGLETDEQIREMLHQVAGRTSAR